MIVLPAIMLVKGAQVAPKLTASNAQILISERKQEDPANASKDTWITTKTRNV